MILYIDPSVSTYAIQTIIGICVALSTFLVIFFRKIRKLFCTIFKLNPKSREIESDDIIIK